MYVKKAFNLNFSTFFTPTRKNPRDSVPLIAECDYELTTGIHSADRSIQRVTNDNCINYLSLYERSRLSD